MISRLFRELKASFAKPEVNEAPPEPNQAALALLIETARSDQHFSTEERRRIADIVSEALGVDGEEREDLIASAISLSDNSTSLFEFTSLIDNHYNPDQKFQLILAMWEVAFTDGELDKYEEHLIRRVADLIYVPHDKFIEAKCLVAEKYSG